MKQKLLRAIEDGRAREAELEAACTDQPANPDRRWNPKDHLAHLAWYRSRSARTLEAVRTGDEFPTPVEGPTQNPIIYTENRDRSTADVKADARRSWSALAAAVERCTEEDLAKPHPRSPDSQVWEIVPGEDGHVGTHLWFWHLDEGEVDRAESAATWAFDVERQAYSDPSQLADATYNFACFCARVGKAEKALGLLREGFASQPALKQLAAGDPDLDSIRDRPEFKELLAT
ncbi:MAG: TPR end-of-group domain-containing protein [Candidatus Dormibacteraceae bacterium]